MGDLSETTNQHKSRKQPKATNTASGGQFLLVKKAGLLRENHDLLKKN